MPPATACCRSASLPPSTAGFNAGFSFISARIYGNHQVEFQSGNGAGTTAVALDTTTPTGTITTGDWLQLVFTTQETASGSFKGTFSLLDYGPTGVAVPTLVLAPVAYTVSGLTTVGTATTMYAGFRTANSGGTSPLEFDNFMVDSSAAKMAYLQQPSSGTAGAPLGAFVAAVEDINSNILVGDTSTVTLTLSHGTFANGQTTVSAQAVDGIATFRTSSSTRPAATSCRATDTNPNLDPGYGPFTINTGPRRQAGVRPAADGRHGRRGDQPRRDRRGRGRQRQHGHRQHVHGDADPQQRHLRRRREHGHGQRRRRQSPRSATRHRHRRHLHPGRQRRQLDGCHLQARSRSRRRSSFLDNFNTGATDFTSNFKVYNNGGANSTSLAWGAAFGVEDQPGPAAGGGVQSSGGVAIDSTAIYTPSKVNLSDGQVHTLSEYVTAVSGLGTGDKPLQIGYLSPTSTGFNAGFSFISARILGNNTVEFQYDNGGTATSIDNTKPTGTIKTGDWLDLIFTTQETASGSFKGTFSLVDYGPTGVGAGTTVLAPVSYTISGLTNLGTASAVSPGFRTATSSGFTGHVRFDNFADPISTGTGGTPVSLAGAFNQVGIVSRRQHVQRWPGRRRLVALGKPAGDQSTWNGTAVHARRRGRQQRRRGGRPDDQPARRELFHAAIPGHGREWQPAQPDVCGDLHRRHDRHVHAGRQRLVHAAKLQRRVGRRGPGLPRPSPTAPRTTARSTSTATA